MIPPHLKKYVVEQDYSRYTPVDQAVWRYILRQLRDFLSEHAHPCYLDGLAKTGISVERIPVIAEMSDKLEKFGWRAVPVSGFIPPSAFMELQSLGFLPIACGMRTLDHLLYTPAPDIVHEAAGHAPILVDPAFAAYLKKYAQVARMALTARPDVDYYDAIRALSDAKEDPDSTPAVIDATERRLREAGGRISFVSEAARLGRMNWWTAEYGLIGGLDKPRIFGAGLLSSVGEARSCLDPVVKKIPLTLECVDVGYDITERQPQLFVTPDFERLVDVLEELAKTMAFRLGGRPAVEQAIRSATVSTVRLDSGLQVSGIIKTCLSSDLAACGSDVAYLQFDGPSQLSFGSEEIFGHGRAGHPQGFGSPVGWLEGATKSLSDFSEHELRELGVEMGSVARLQFRSGVVVEGRVIGWTRAPSGALAIISFRECWAHRGGDKVLFRPEWGTFDMAVGARVESVFGGPGDRERYGEPDGPAARTFVPRAPDSPDGLRKQALYSEIRASRESASIDSDAAASRLLSLLLRTKAELPDAWLPRLELIEAAERLPVRPPWAEGARDELRALGAGRREIEGCIADGLRLAAPP